MKRLLLLFVVLFSASTIANAQNLVANGDFEEWSWGNLKDWGRFMSADVEQSTESQSGEYSALLTLDNFGNYLSFIYAENITFEKGKTYDISFYYWIKKGGLTQFTASASYKPDGSIWDEELFSEDVPELVTQDTWKKFSMTHTELTGTKLEKFQILVRSTADATILIDNVVITEQGATSIDEDATTNMNIYFNQGGKLVVDGIENIESVKIYSLDGKLVSTDSTILPSGVYVTVVKGDGVIISKKVIK